MANSIKYLILILFLIEQSKSNNYNECYLIEKEKSTYKIECTPSKNNHKISINSILNSLTDIKSLDLSFNNLNEDNDLQYINNFESIFKLNLSNNP